MVNIIIFFLYVSPLELPIFISFLLAKTKNKSLKYLSPMICLIITIIFYIKWIFIKCIPDLGDLHCTNDFYDAYFTFTFGIGFLSSLFYCIIKDNYVLKIKNR